MALSMKALAMASGTAFGRPVLMGSPVRVARFFPASCGVTFSTFTMFFLTGFKLLGATNIRDVVTSDADGFATPIVIFVGAEPTFFALLVMGSPTFCTLLKAYPLNIYLPVWTCNAP